MVDRRYGRGVVAVFNSPAAFCFHTINAWEDRQEDGAIDIICDLIKYDNLDVLHKFYYENMRSSSPTAATFMKERQDACNQHFARYKLSDIRSIQTLRPQNLERKCTLPSPRAADRILTVPNPMAGDLPTMNAAYATRPYRYFYNCTFSTSRSTFVEGLNKVDLHTGTATRWDGPQGHTPGEAIFVADPSGTEEDDGVLLTIVLDGFAGTSYMLCLDAKTMKELGRADCKGPIAFTFDGQHVQSSSEEGHHQLIDV